MSQLQNLHILPIIIAAIAAWFFGAFYYGLLGRKWVEAQGKTMEQHKAASACKSTPAKAAPFVISFIAELVMAGTLASILFHFGSFTSSAGIATGAMCWLGFVLTTVVVNNAYSLRKMTLTVIDTGHWLGVLVIIGAVVGWLGP